MVKFIEGFKEGFHTFGESIAITVNSILLIIVYIIGVGPTSLISKITGKSFLDKSIDDRETYYEDWDLSKRPEEEYYRQF